jgi:acetoacetate decarboxylase
MRTRSVLLLLAAILLILSSQSICSSGDSGKTPAGQAISGRLLTPEYIAENAFSMPFTCPSYPKRSFDFKDREFFIITYETDIEALRKVIPEPLEIVEPIVKYEFIHMPSGSGLGSFFESGQIIPVKFEEKEGTYVHSMYLNCMPAIVNGREIWGFPKKLGNPNLFLDRDILTGTLDYGQQRVALGTMGYMWKNLDTDEVRKSLSGPNFCLKIIPRADGTGAQICQLVRYHMKNLVVKEAWTGPVALQLFENALAPVADLPVRKVLSGIYIKTDLSIAYGDVVYDYLKMQGQSLGKTARKCKAKTIVH